MDLGFDETQSPYQSGSQSARFLTEAWTQKSVFCPNCGSPKLDKFPNNRPVADFVCSGCREEFELKSQKTSFGARVVDGAYRTMCERITAENNPNFLFLNYSLTTMGVVDLFVVPKHFFVPEVLEKRKPLAVTARRAGWVGCNILLRRIPESGKIFFVRDGRAVDQALVLSRWQRTIFLRDQSMEAKGWLVEVMKCVELLGRQDFTLNDMYGFEQRLRSVYPNNQNVRPKIRQQLQFLRDKGYLDFVRRGTYRLRSLD